MAITVTTGSRTLLSVSQAGHTADYRMTASFTGNDLSHSIRRRITSYKDSVQDDECAGGNNSSYSNSWDSTTNGQNDITCEADQNGYKWRAWVTDLDDSTPYYGSYSNFTSAAVTATSSTPTSSSVTDTTATIACNFYPNTLDSTATVWLEYKKTSDSTWTQAGATASSSGYSQDSISRNITGLSSSTQYNVRLQMTRTTVNETTLTSATANFTTLAGAPTVTTVAASSIGAAAAQLNATVTINSGSHVYVYWIWDIVSPPVANTTTSTLITTDGSYSINITGLDPSVTYYFRAAISYTTPSGSPSLGSILNFTTLSGLPAGYEEDHMITQYVDAIYGATVDVYFTLRLPSGTSSNEFYTGTEPDNATESEVWIDGTSDGALDNVISRLNGSVVGNILYKTTVSAAQTSGDVIDIIIKDATASEAFRDHHIQIRTKQRLGQIVVDATNKTNTTAVTYTGVGSGHGLSLVSGATGKDLNGVIGNFVLNEGTIDSNDSNIQCELSNTTAVATNDWYNGGVILLTGGTGAGQARTIIDYTSAYKCIVNRAWTMNPDNTTTYVILPGPETWTISPGAELSAMPSFSSNYADMLQFLFQRFAYKRTQTATTFTMKKSTAGGGGNFVTGGVDDDGTTQTHNQLS